MGNDNQPGETRFAALRLTGAQHSSSLKTAKIQKHIWKETAVQNTGLGQCGWQLALCSTQGESMELTATFKSEA